MAANSFGQRFVVTTFGESHGTALGVVIDGMPAGIAWDEAILSRELERRRPGQSAVVSGRAESDQPEVLSGVFEGKTLGTPIAMIVRNTDTRSGDYKSIAQNPRAGHADDVWKQKFNHSDPRGGGRSSGRETVSRVMAGAVARMMLAQSQSPIYFTGFAKSIGSFELTAEDYAQLKPAAQNPADTFVARFPSATQTAKVEKLLLDAKAEGKSYGGIAELWVDGLPKGLGQPIFHKLKSDLAMAMMSIGATAGVELGAGFASANEEGSAFHSRSENADYGGIRGGISTGERLILRVAFKPTSSVLDVAKKGRHDPCIVPRAIPVMEAMAAIVIADHLLLSKTDQIF